MRRWERGWTRPRRSGLSSSPGWESTGERAWSDNEEPTSLSYDAESSGVAYHSWRSSPRCFLHSSPDLRDHRLRELRAHHLLCPLDGPFQVVGDRPLDDGPAQGA